MTDDELDHTMWSKSGCDCRAALLATAGDRAVSGTPEQPDYDVPKLDADRATLDAPLAVPTAFKTAVHARRLRLRPWWCKRFLTPKGCRHGTSCRFPHLTSTQVAAERAAHRVATATRSSEA